MVKHLEVVCLLCYYPYSTKDTAMSLVSYVLVGHWWISSFKSLAYSLVNVNFSCLPREHAPLAQKNNTGGRCCRPMSENLLVKTTAVSHFIANRKSSSKGVWRVYLLQCTTSLVNARKQM